MAFSRCVAGINIALITFAGVLALKASTANQIRPTRRRVCKAISKWVASGYLPQMPTSEQAITALAAASHLSAAVILVPQECTAPFVHCRKQCKHRAHLRLGKLSTTSFQV